MECWNCKSSIEEPLYGKLSFRATCERCLAGLHCCVNCKYYQPGRANDCLLPGTEPISDRRANNFCEEFALRKGEPSPKEGDSKRRFDDLFR